MIHNIEYLKEKAEKGKGFANFIRISYVIIYTFSNIWFLYNAIEKGDVEINLDQSHPKEKEETIDLSPHELINQIIEDERKTLDLLEDVEKLIQKEIPK